MNPLVKLHGLGQSIWLDFFSRDVMNSGNLQKWIDEDQLAGITSNPSIFEKALSEGNDYDEDVQKFAQEDSDLESIFFKFAVKDIQRATDILRPVYDAAGGTDGCVSLEVSPFIAHDAAATTHQALDLWKRIDRKNAMIKIPATKEGLQSIKEATAAGVNVNITLLFGLDRYKAVVDAYMTGLEERVSKGEPIDNIFSVASFFLSRVDVLLDPQLKEKGLNDLVGEIAIDLAKSAYKIYEEEFSSERFKKLEAKGANKQKLLWASTGTKDPSYSDVKYVEALIGDYTVNTLPINTIDAYRDHGKPELTVKTDMDKVAANLKKLESNGFDLNQISDQLEAEGIEKFNKAFNNLLKAIKDKSGK